MLHRLWRGWEFVTDFEPKTPRLGEAGVMGMAWRSPATLAPFLG